MDDRLKASDLIWTGPPVAPVRVPFPHFGRSNKIREMAENKFDSESLKAYLDCVGQMTQRMTRTEE